MEEQIFLDQGEVKVTNARFIVKGQTYAMNGVTSVKQGVNQPNRAPPIFLAFVGLVLILNQAFLWGIVLTGFAVFWLTRQQPDWVVILHSASGEVKALTSQDSEFIKAVINALNESIIHRG